MFHSRDFVLIFENFKLPSTNFGIAVMSKPKIAIVTSYYERKKSSISQRHQTYLMALDSVQCYARMHNYEFIMIDLKNFEYNKSRCAHPDPLFSRHCILAEYMEKRADLSYFLFIGGDMGVINPMHKIEEYIIPGMDLFFYYRLGILRFKNGSFVTPSVKHDVKRKDINFWGLFDIMADSFILRNTNYSRTFLRHWADSYYRVKPFGTNAYHNDNPVLHFLWIILPKIKIYVSSC
uniref:Uncharacterized protein n=1 Tax=Acrobeloides nanus TaxID=290746 RepID=A0A914E8R9_9BILA